jgi:hypothetical protein
MQRQSPKTELKGAYRVFLNSEAGKDLVKHAAYLEKAYVLQAIKAETSEEKAHAVCKMEGLVTLRDYIVRMAK